MPDQVLYLRGDFLFGGFRDFAGPDFIEDARAVLKVPQEIVQGIAAALSVQPGFIDPEGLAGIVRTHVAAPDQSKRIVNFIVNLERILRQTGLSAEELATRFPDLLRANIARIDTRQGEPVVSPLSPEEVDELTRRAAPIFGARSALARQRKAERLLKVTGHPLEEFQLICDLRPVFDDERGRVDGMFPTTTLRVVATGDEGLPITLEARMSRQQLEDLEKKVSLALLKLRSLSELLAQKGIAEPTLGRGREGER